MSPVEVNEKMTLDETPCCQRKRKRLRAKYGSDDESDVYIPKTAEPISGQKRRTRNSLSHANGSTGDSNDEARMDIDDDHLPLIPCEQTMIESVNETVNPDGTINSRTPAVKPSLLPTKRIVSLPPSRFASVRGGGVRRNNTPLRILPSVNNRPPMVTIPKGQTLQSLPKSRPLTLIQKRVPAPAAPSVINIESDEEEPEIIEDSAISSKSTPTPTPEVVAEVNNEENISEYSIFHMYGIIE